MLESIAEATELPSGEVEVLCSWNGTNVSEQKIVNRSGYEFLIAQRETYHFAGNMNQLAKHANGDVLAFLNDDLILDNGSLDSGLSCLLVPSRYAFWKKVICKQMCHVCMFIMMCPSYRV